MIIKITIIALSVLLFLILLIITISVLLARLVARPHTISYEDEIAYEKEHGMWKNFEELPREQYTIKSFDGYELNTLLIPAAAPSDRYVIISHGYGGCALGSVKYLHMFHALGFNAIMYDNRGHGSNKKTPCTMGHNESRDLLSVINHTYKRFGDKITLGLHGESMGSALTINALRYGLNVKFIISDCGYNDLEKLLTRLIRVRVHLPLFFVKCSSIASRLIYGYKYSEIKPINCLPSNDIPICFIHGKSDDFILCSHAAEMHDLQRGYGELHLFEGAGHAYSIVKDEAGYRKIVADFLKKQKIIK